MWILAALAAAAPQFAEHETAVQIVIESGRAELASPAGVRDLRPDVGSLEHQGAGYLQVAAASRAAVHFEGLGSLRVVGPTELEWFKSRAGDVWVWHLPRLKEVHLETRRGGVRLELPGRWRLATGTGALWLHQRPSAAIDLHHDAGDGFVLVPPTPADMASPPLAVAPGARLRLEGDALASLGSAGAPDEELWSARGVRVAAEHQARVGAPWPDFVWPWGPPSSGEDEGGQQARRSAAAADLERFHRERQAAAERAASQPIERPQPRAGPSADAVDPEPVWAPTSDSPSEGAAGAAERGSDSGPEAAQTPTTSPTTTSPTENVEDAGAGEQGTEPAELPEEPPPEFPEAPETAGEPESASTPGKRSSASEEAAWQPEPGERLLPAPGEWFGPRASMQKRLRRRVSFQVEPGCLPELGRGRGLRTAPARP